MSATEQHTHDADALRQADLEARELIRLKTDENVFVQAGAGSGKTTTLIQRLLTLLIRDGVTIDQIAAITFTEAAAGKLVADLRNALTEVAQTGQHTPFKNQTTTFDDPGAEDAKARAHRALEGLPGAAIGTLHSFCLRLLKQFPLEAGLPPKVDKVDELRQLVDATGRTDAAVDLFTRLAADDPTAREEVAELRDAYDLAVDPESVGSDFVFLLEHKATIGKIADQVKWMDEHWGALAATLDAPEVKLPSHDDDLAEAEAAYDALSDLRDAFKGSGGKPCADEESKDTLLARVEDAAEAFQAAAKGEVADLSAWRPVIPSPGRYGDKNKWAGVSLPESAITWLRSHGLPADETEGKAGAAGLLQAVKQHYEDRGLPRMKRAHRQVTTVLAALVTREKDARIRRGTLEYHDMIYLARDLVVDPANEADEARKIERATVRARLHQQYPVIVVDEFQDTDPVQYEIVRAIAAGSGDKPLPGRLFMVGDPKQSIYKFRNADIDNYDSVMRSYAAPGTEDEKAEGMLLTLSQNFRSSERVTGAVNALFEQMFGASTRAPGLPTQAQYEAMLDQGVATGLHSDGSSVQLPGRVVFVHSAESAANPEAKRSVEERREAEEADIIALIRAATENNDPSYLKHKPDDKTRIASPLTYSDIAILVYANKDSLRIIRALERAGIPAVSEGSASIFYVPEINDLLTVLRAIGDPADGFAQIAALRTALIGCSDAQIAEHEAAERATRASGAVVAGETFVAEQQEKLDELSRQVRSLDAGGAARAVAQEFGLVEGFVASHQAHALGSLNHFFGLADEFSRSTGLGVREFVRWADEQAPQTQGPSDPVLDNNAGGVRVMTIHKSKGLEFPMVIVAGVSGDHRDQDVEHGMTRTNPPRAIIKLGEAVDDEYAETKAYEHAADNGELVRLLYVALTRAESVLAVPLHANFLKKTKDGYPYSKTKGTPLLNALRALGEAAGPEGLAELAERGLVLVDRQDLSAPSHPIETAPRTLDVASGTDISSERLVAALNNAAGVAPRIGVTAIAHAGHQVEEERAGDAGDAGDTDANRKPEKENPETTNLPYATKVTGQRLRPAVASQAATPLGHHTHVNANVKRKATGTNFGSAVHEVMERLLVSGVPITPEEIARLAQVSAARYDLDGSAAAEVADAARAFSKSKPFEKAVAPATVCYPELPVADMIDGVAVNGYIDLLYKDGEGWVIADYKTDAYARPERVESYLTQLELYAQIVEKVLGEPVVRLELIFLDGTKPDGTQLVTLTRGTA